MDPLDRVREELLDWELDDDGIHRTIEVDDYGAAMALTVRIGLEAQRRNHHPDITVGWGTVKVSLVTHDADSSVTDKDVDLAAWIDGVTAPAG
ncbi:4a-hydroxytetrahydrobiopterin dehydratase [Salsipaludibacter albus]|uniref:4a-hydroxytetrahydrobiopterin dehydratase n=1 Tax=Salsipaludibacter albus TaxID=2849650 RepID=UPI001EE40967|nr:4a-hydroxytetrahydrobiopterin dehydratase [Salsipaludibacter albus]MBY5162754.1 4a-hydroxytetrahydrobiopterin dehydratase [Salsipaludibacter albus]